MVSDERSDDVVERAVERAATKVAEVVNPINGHSALSRAESLAAVAIIIVVGMMNLVINIQTRNDIRGHAQDFKVICQLIVEDAPAESAKALAVKLAECLE